MGAITLTSVDSLMRKGVANLEIAGDGGREKRIDARLDTADDDFVQRIGIQKVAHAFGSFTSSLRLRFSWFILMRSV